MLKHKSFLVGTILAMSTFGLMIACENLMPIYVQNGLGGSALLSGLMLLPGAILMGAFSPVTGKIFDKFGPRLLALVGLSIVAVTSFAFVKISLATPIAVMAAIYAIRLLGITMITMPMTTWGINTLDNSLLAHGTSVNACFRQIFGSIITALSITAMTSGQSRFADPASAEALLHGFHNAFWLATILAVVLLVLSLVTVHDYDGIASFSRRKN